MITYDIVRCERDLNDILTLQTANLPEVVSIEDLESEGFVTVRHNLSILNAMSAVHPHIVAREDDRLIAYALVMTKKFAWDIPILIPMFEKIQEARSQALLPENSNYVIMGQICVDKSYRGQGVFRGLYNKMKAELRSQYQCIITEVDISNKRSVRAHEAVGFQSLIRYDASGITWDLLAWNISS